MLPLIETVHYVLEMHALSEVLFLLDACVASVAAVAAARVGFGRLDDHLYAWAAGVLLAASATLLGRSMLDIADPLYMRLAPALSIVLLAAGFAIRRLRPESRRRTGRPDGPLSHA